MVSLRISFLSPRIQAAVLDAGLLSSKNHSLVPEIQTVVLDAGLLSCKNHSLVPQIQAIVMDAGLLSSKNHFRFRVKCLATPSKRCTSVHISKLAVACLYPLPTTARNLHTQNVRVILIEHTV
jgi:hypothetical protein